MARKRKGLEHLDYNSQEYWNRVLVDEGLSMDRGRDPRVIYMGLSSQLDFGDSGYQQCGGGRRIKPKPQCD